MTWLNKKQQYLSTNHFSVFKKCHIVQDYLFSCAGALLVVVLDFFYGEGSLYNAVKILQNFPLKGPCVGYHSLQSMNH